MALPAPSRSAPRVALAAVAFLIAMTAPACGSGSSDASGTGEGDTVTTSAPTGSGATEGHVGAGAGDGTEASTGAPDLDLCSEITSDDIGSILTEADISTAQPNPALDTPACQYLVDWAGSPLPVVQITWNEDGFLDALRESNPNATDLDGADGVAVSETSIIVAGESGDFQIDGGAEQAEGGSVATQDQLVAIAQLTKGL